MYKQYVKKTFKIHNKYVKFTPHPCNMDGANAPKEDLLRKFRFLDVNTTLANTVQDIQNAQGPIASTSKKDTSYEAITAIVKEKLNEEQQQLKRELIGKMRALREETLTAAKAYTDRATENLSDCISLQFEELINNIKTTQKMLKDPNQRQALPSSLQEKLN
jgi:hypothetical protein